MMLRLWSIQLLSALSCTRLLVNSMPVGRSGQEFLATSALKEILDRGQPLLGEWLCIFAFQTMYNEHRCAPFPRYRQGLLIPFEGL